MWFVEQLDPRAARAYLIGGGVDLLGALNLPALRQALDRILARHEALRTCLSTTTTAPHKSSPPPRLASRWNASTCATPPMRTHKRSMTANWKHKRRSTSPADR
ncbi:hypothetical protein [Xanthomonas oryzae]|uniref:hypothetical protein n=1 Tax=Xanthomonas oryzae TaxID=347 RepID=UPI003CCFF39F